MPGFALSGDFVFLAVLWYFSMVVQRYSMCFPLFFKYISLFWAFLKRLLGNICFFWSRVLKQIQIFDVSFLVKPVPCCSF